MKTSDQRMDYLCPAQLQFYILIFYQCLAPEKSVKTITETIQFLRHLQQHLLIVVFSKYTISTISSYSKVIRKTFSTSLFGHISTR
jgi:hypothetical protein